ncbi:MAG: hypothetical protein Kow00128_02340 [Deltaproteobacteria bacterium]
MRGTVSRVVRLFRRISSSRIRLFAGLCALLFPLLHPLCSTAAGSSLVVGIYDNPPTVFRDEKGAPAGFYVEILDEIARREGWSIRYEYGVWTDLLDSLKAGRIDLLCAVARSPEREALFEYNREPFTERKGIVYVRRGSPIRSIHDLFGKRVAVGRNDIHGGLFRQAADLLGIVPEILEKQGYAHVFRSVAEGEADAGVANRIFGNREAGRYGLAATGIFLRPVPLFVAAPKGRGREILEAVDAHLRRWKRDRDSPYFRLHTLWLGPPRTGAEFPLSASERAWLSRHRRIRIAFDGNFPPYSFRKEDGSFEGLAVDILDRLAERIGIEWEVHPEGVWNALLEAAVRRDVDVVATMVDRPGRRRWFAFTRPYLFKSLVILARSDDPSIRSRVDLAGKTVALVRGYQYVPRILSEIPSLKPRFVSTMREGLEAVSAGIADAAVSFLGGAHFLRARYQIPNLRVAAVYDPNRSNESIAVRADWPELASILDRALDSIPEEEMHALLEKWLPPEAVELVRRAVPLTPEERAWIRNHPVVRLGVDPEFFPYEYLDEDGSYRGIAADVVSLIERRTGLSMRVVPGISWREAVERAKRGEIDVLSCIGKTAERESFLAYTAPYAEFQRVLFTRNDSPFLSRPEDLPGRTVAVQANSSHEGYLREYSDLHPVPYPTLGKALAALSTGEVDAFVGNLASSAHAIRAAGFTNLRVTAILSTGTLHMGIRRDRPVLARILSKGIASISPTERREIARRWIGIEVPEGIPFRIVKRYGALLGGAVLLGLAGFYGWNFHLKREIAARKEAEAHLRKITELKSLIAEISASLGHVPPGELDGRILSALERVARLLGERSACFSLRRTDGSCCETCAYVWADEGVRTGRPGGPEIGKDKRREALLREMLRGGPRDGAADGALEAAVSVPTMCNAPSGGEGTTQEDLREMLGVLAQVFRNALLERKLRRELEEANAAALAASRAKSAFLANMSHELRTPLNSIIGFTGILRKEMAGPLNEEQKKQMEMVAGSAKHLLALIGDVLDLSKIEAGELAVHREPFALRPVLEQAAGELRRRAEAKGLVLALEMDPPNGTIVSDRFRIRQILLNLLDNAIKFTDRGEIRIDCRIADGRVELSVRDTGIGIRPEEIGSLFQPFRQLDAGPARRYEGTGLGLAICRRLAEMLGGGIRVESRYGEGSVFTLELPISEGS